MQGFRATLVHSLEGLKSLKIVDAMHLKLHVHVHLPKLYPNEFFGVIPRCKIFGQFSLLEGQKRVKKTEIGLTRDTN